MFGTISSSACPNLNGKTITAVAHSPPNVPCEHVGVFGLFIPCAAGINLNFALGYGGTLEGGPTPPGTWGIVLFTSPGAGFSPSKASTSVVCDPFTLVFDNVFINVNPSDAAAQCFCGAATNGPLTITFTN